MVADGVAAGLLRHQQVAGPAVVGDNTVNDLLCTLPCVVAHVADRLAIVHAKQLIAGVPGIGGASFLRHAAADVVGDGLSVPGCQLVLPGVVVRSCDGPCRCAGNGGGCRVSVLLQAGHVAAGVIRVDNGLVLDTAVFTDQLVPLVVAVPYKLLCRKGRCILLYLISIMYL